MNSVAFEDSHKEYECDSRSKDADYLERCDVLVVCLVVTFVSKVRVHP